MKKFRLQTDDVKREIDWKIAEEAYKGYKSKFPSSAADQLLEKINNRGGFGVFELINLLIVRIEDLEKSRSRGRLDVLNNRL